MLSLIAFINQNNEMNSGQEIISKIEQDLQISFNESLISICYDSEKGIINELKISDLHFENFDALSSLFDTIKKLEIYLGCTFHEKTLFENLKKFTALETLCIETASLKSANEILSLKNLKNLDLWVSINPETHHNDTYELNITTLSNLKNLGLYCSHENSSNTFIIQGIENLNNLKVLSLESNCEIEINGLSRLTKLNKLKLFNIDIKSIPYINSLKTLYCSHSSLNDFHCSGKFPNLENLKIEGFTNLNLGTLKKLKILVMGAEEFDLKNTTCFNHLPNLEQLSLTNCNISILKNLGQLKNLKMLNLSENHELCNIDELESLKALERLNLYDNKISDVRMLNRLPNLKQVNLAENKIEKEEILYQLNNPDIACFLGFPKVPFIIGGSKIF